MTHYEQCFKHTGNAIGSPNHPVTQHALQLIDHPPDAGFAKRHVDGLVVLLAQITGISADDELGEGLGLDLESGVALSPVQAAKCLQDLMRTHTFVHAVAQAIRDQLRTRASVEILYAGTGPYGLLLLPVLSCLCGEPVHATLIDIHPENIRAVDKVVEALGIRHHIRLIALADATRWDPPDDSYYDIILSETMNWMLKNEPQVQIFSHLVQYLRNAQSVLIPEQVILDAKMYNARQYSEFRQGQRGCPDEINVGVIATLNRGSATAIAAGHREVLDNELKLPVVALSHTELKVRTEIQVYRRLWLREDQSSLNISLRIDARQLQPGDRIGFIYSYGDLAQGERPGYQIRLPNRLQSTSMCAPASFYEAGALGILHLKRLWHKAQLERDGRLNREIRRDEWQLDQILIDHLGLGLEECVGYLYGQAPTFGQFENWVRDQGSDLTPMRVGVINKCLKANVVKSGCDDSLNTEKQSRKRFTTQRSCLTRAQKTSWQEQGYLVVEEVLDEAQCRASVDTIYRYLEKSPELPETWYKLHPSQQNVMVQLFRNPILDANRRSEKVRRVFAELWQTERLRYSIDRVGFNPPETRNYPFYGTRLHWDIDFCQPLAFRTQGLIYLTDVTENQGAFCCVPGFHNKLSEWLAKLPPGADPNQQDLSSLHVHKVAAPAGSLIVWNNFLPHGGSPNRAAKPRLVQYINMLPT